MTVENDEPSPCCAEAARLEIPCACAVHPRFRLLIRRDRAKYLPATIRTSRFFAGLDGPVIGADPGSFPGPIPAGRVRVGFLSPVLSERGGTETWHETLLSRLDHSRLGVAGLAILDAAGGHPGAMARVGGLCPVAAGEEAARRLADSVDVLVLWGVARPGDYLPPRGDPRRPTVVFVSHGDASSAWSRSVMESASPEVDRFVAVSTAALGPIPADRRAGALVIPNGTDPARAAPTRPRAEVRGELGIGREEFALLYNGRLSGEKRPALAVESLRHLPDRFRLVVAGDGWQRDEVRRAAEGLGRRVLFLGFRADTGDLLGAADVLLNPSDQEGFGLSMAEAWAAGVPVIATPLGAAAIHPELVRAVPVEAGPRVWAAAILADAADSEGTARRAAEARATAARLYSAEAFGRSWSDLLASLPARPDAAEPALPSVTRQAANFARASVRHVADGRVKAAPELVAARLAACAVCERFRASDRRCAHRACGCPVDRKARYRSESCPLGRWPSPSTTQVSTNAVG